MRVAGQVENDLLRDRKIAGEGELWEQSMLARTIVTGRVSVPKLTQASILSLIEAIAAVCEACNDPVNPVTSPLPRTCVFRPLESPGFDRGAGSSCKPLNESSASAAAAVS